MFVELRFCSSLGPLQSQTSDDAVGPAEQPPVAKSDTGRATVTKQTRTTPWTEAMLVTSCERDCKTLKDVFVWYVDNVVREAALVGGVQQVVVRRDSLNVHAYKRPSAQVVQAWKK